MIFSKFFANASNRKALDALDRAHQANESGNLDAAIRYFSLAMDCPDQAIKVEALAWRSQLYVATEQYKEALHDLNKALTMAPEEWGLYGKRGEVYFLMSSPELALADCERGLSMDDGDQYARKVMATILKHQQRFLEALTETEIILAENPSDPWALTLHAELLFATGNFEDCIHVATNALEVAGQEAVHAFHVRADALSRLGQYKEAVSDFTRALEVGGDDPLIYVGRAECYLSLDRVENAAWDASRATALDPQSDAAFNTSARVHLARAQVKAAMSDADVAVALNGENYFARKTRAKCFMIQEQWHDAILDLTVALKHREPLMRSSCYGLRAQCYNKLEMYDDAMTDANRGEECDPQSGMSFANRAYAFFKMGDVDASLGECARGLRVDRGQPELHKVKAQALMAQYDYEGAVAAATWAIELDQRYIQAYEVRAMALEYMQQYEDAARDRRRAEVLTRTRLA
jgi:tetratricopeptide (TPR) repeat protein